MMKKVLLLVMFFMALTLKAQEFKFETEVLDFGNIIQGSENIQVFEFINIGDAPLIIKTIKGSGVIPRCPEKPIMPGEKGEIELSYRYSNTLGSFSRSFTIFSNAKTERKLFKIKGNVIPKE